MLNLRFDGICDACDVLCTDDVDGGEGECEVDDGEDGVDAECVPAVGFDEVLELCTQGSVWAWTFGLSSCITGAAAAGTWACW